MFTNVSPGRYSNHGLYFISIFNNMAVPLMSQVLADLTKRVWCVVPPCVYTMSIQLHFWKFVFCFALSSILYN